MTIEIDLHLHDHEGLHAIKLVIDRMYNLGFTIRDPELMREHIEEIENEGIPVPEIDNPPVILPISPWVLTTNEEILIQRGITSGEVEIVTIMKPDGTLFVGVGSDHTDRKLEAVDLAWGKQVCPNILAPVVWSYAEVEDHWDEIVLESWVGEEDELTLYQQVSAGYFWTPREMADAVSKRVKPGSGTKVLFSGTVVSLDRKIKYSKLWKIKMIDAVLNRTIEHSYRVIVLEEELL